MVSKPVHLTWTRGRSHKVIQAAKTSVNSQSLGCCILQRGLGWILATCHNPFITTRQNTIDVVQTSIKKIKITISNVTYTSSISEKDCCDGDTTVLNRSKCQQSRQKRHNPWTVRRVLTVRRNLWFLMFSGLCMSVHIYVFKCIDIIYIYLEMIIILNDWITVFNAKIILEALKPMFDEIPNKQRPQHGHTCIKNAWTTTCSSKLTLIPVLTSGCGAICTRAEIWFVETLVVWTALSGGIPRQNYLKIFELGRVWHLQWPHMIARHVTLFLRRF